MMTDCRPIFADERSASRAVFCHAIIPLKHRPFLTSGAANVAGHATAPHALERALGFRVKMRKHICINIPSGGCQLHQHSIWGMPGKTESVDKGVIKATFSTLSGPLRHWDCVAIGMFHTFS